MAGAALVLPLASLQRPAEFTLAHLGALPSGPRGALVVPASVRAAVGAAAEVLGATAPALVVPAHALAALAEPRANHAKRPSRAEGGMRCQGASCRTPCSFPSKRSTARLPSTSVASDTGRFQIRTRLAIVSRA